MTEQELREQIAHDRSGWDSIIAQVNRLRKELDNKPDIFKVEYQVNPGGILNAYREGDLTFKEAVEALENWKQSGYIKRPELELISELDAIEWAEKHGHSKVDVTCPGFWTGAIIRQAQLDADRKKCEG